MGDLRILLCCSLLPLGAGTVSLHGLSIDQATASPAPVAMAAAAPRAPVTIPRDADGLFYVTLRVNERPVRFMVDTGASMVVLSRHDAHAAGISGKGDRSIRLHTAGGGMQASRVSIPRIAHDRQVYHDVDAVVTHHELPVSLLGQNLLSRLGTVSFQGDRMTIAGEIDGLPLA